MFFRKNNRISKHSLKFSQYSLVKGDSFSGMKRLDLNLMQTKENSVYEFE